MTLLRELPYIARSDAHSPELLWHEVAECGLLQHRLPSCALLSPSRQPSVLQRSPASLFSSCLTVLSGVFAVKAEFRCVPVVRLQQACWVNDQGVCTSFRTVFGTCVTSFMWASLLSAWMMQVCLTSLTIRECRGFGSPIGQSDRKLEDRREHSCCSVPQLRQEPHTQI